MNPFNSSSRDYEYNPLVAKYEELRQKQKSFYLDPYEFIEIANFYLNQLNYKEAKEALLNGLKIHRLETNLLIELAHLYLELEKIDKVKQILQQLKGIHLFEVEAIRAEILLMEEEEVEKVEKLFLLSADPIDLDQKLTVAQLFLAYQYPDKALDWLLPVYGENDHNLEYLELLARGHLMNLDFFNAAKTYDALLNLVPYEADYWNKLGHCYYLEEDFEAAEEAYSFALLCDKKISEPYLFGAYSLLHQQKEQRANQLLNKGIKENLLLPEEKYYYWSLFYYLQEEEEKAYNKLLEGIKKMEGGNGNHVLLPYYFLTILCLIRLENYDEAYEYCSKALQIYQESPDQNTDESWLIVPTRAQFEDLMNLSKEKSYSSTGFYLQYTRQLLALLNPFLWRDKSYSLLAMEMQPFNEPNLKKTDFTVKKESEIQNQLEEIYLEILLESEQNLASLNDNAESKESGDTFFKSLLEDNPGLAATWKEEIKNLMQNN